MGMDENFKNAGPEFWENLIKEADLDGDGTVKLNFFFYSFIYF